MHRSEPLRSQRFEGWGPLEKVFDEEVDNLNQGLSKLIQEHRAQSPDTENILRSLLEASIRYIDELNKIRKYKCPLSMSILLGSLMEGVFNYVCVKERKVAQQTASWRRWEEKKRQADDEIPLAYLIGVVEDMKLLRTEGITKAISDLSIEWLEHKYRIVWDPKLTNNFAVDSRDVRVHGKKLHRLKNWRNAVHPMQLIKDGKTQANAEEFLDVMFDGLALLLLLETIVGIKTKYPISDDPST